MLLAEKILRSANQAFLFAMANTLEWMPKGECAACFVFNKTESIRFQSNNINLAKGGSVVFFENSEQKNIIDKSVKNIEQKFNKQVVTYIKKFKEFYVAETYHQDYYEKNFIRYLMYKKGCQREETLNKIWG